MTVDILGAQWTIVERAGADDAMLSDCDGYCDWTARLIVIEREIDGNLDDMERYIRKVKRHEIIHAFLFECGLAESTMPTQAWSQNEEMVDWFARLGERIYKAWKDADAVEDCDKCPKAKIEENIYDEEEIHHNCTVQILRNSITGKTSIGWWEEVCNGT